MDVDLITGRVAPRAGDHVRPCRAGAADQRGDWGHDPAGSARQGPISAVTRHGDLGVGGLSPVRTACPSWPAGFIPDHLHQMPGREQVQVGAADVLEDGDAVGRGPSRGGTRAQVVQVAPDVGFQEQA